MLKARKFQIIRTHKDPTKAQLYIGEYLYQPSKKRGNTFRRKRLGKLSELEHLGQAWLDEQLDLYTQAHQFIAVDENGHEIEPSDDELMKLTRKFHVDEAPCAKLITDLGIQKLLVKQANNHKVPKSWPKTALSLVMHRIMEPCSKRSIDAKMQASLYDYSDVNLGDVYNVLAFLAKIKDKLIQGLNDGLAAIKDRDLSVVIYDVSTFDVERFDEDERRQKGKSQDTPRTETQVVLALLIDKEGIPYAYELFFSNTHESNSMIPELQKFLQAHHLDPKQVIVVANAGLHQGHHLHAMIEAGFSFIVGFPINGKGSNDWQNAILDNDGWEALSADARIKSIDPTLARNIVLDEAENMTLAFDGRFVIGFSEARRLHDLRLIEKQAKVDTDLNQSVRPANVTPSIQWAGYMGLITNIDESRMSIRQIFEQQHAKWQVEENFRFMKTPLETCPIDVHKKAHIEGHFVMGYMALFLTRVMQWKCRAAGLDDSLAAIQHAFCGIDVSKSSVDSKFFEILGSHEPIGPHGQASYVVAQKVCQALGMPALKTPCTMNSLQALFEQRWLKLKKATLLES